MVTPLLLSVAAEMLKTSVSTAKLFAQTGTPELHALLFHEV